MRQPRIPSEPERAPSELTEKLAKYEATPGFKTQYQIDEIISSNGADLKSYSLPTVKDSEQCSLDIARLKHQQTERDLLPTDNAILVSALETVWDATPIGLRGVWEPEVPNKIDGAWKRAAKINEADGKIHESERRIVEACDGRYSLETLTKPLEQDLRQQTLKSILGDYISATSNTPIGPMVEALTHKKRLSDSAISSSHSNDNRYRAELTKLPAATNEDKEAYGYELNVWDRITARHEKFVFDSTGKMSASESYDSQDRNVDPPVERADWVLSKMADEYIVRSMSKST